MRLLFDGIARWLTTYPPRSVVSEYMRIDEEAAGRCAHRTLRRPKTA